MKQQYIKKIGLWTKKRWKKIPEKDSQHTTWFFLSFAITTTILAIISALGAPIGQSVLSHSMNISLFILLNSFIFIVWSIVVSLLFSFIYIPLPRMFLAGYTYTMTATAIVFIVAKSGVKFSIMIGILAGTAALILGLLFVLLFHSKIARIIKIVGGIGILIIGFVFFLSNTTQTNSVDAPAFFEQANTDNPAQFSDYIPNFFTYGSGVDVQRKAFGDEVDYVTDTVDASDFITRWSNKRAKFWGFTQETLPLNGRVWVPDGDGPFPVMLIAHGNHTMEYFSTGGYDYLGELLASRGFITISVDQDFINYSSRHGSPNRNYELRAWILLQHVVQLQRMNDTPGNFLSEKIDFENIAFAGHSRGGQAALMAADYKTYFPEDESLKTIEDVDVKGVIAISPTDKLVDKKRAEIHNTSYLLLHGARDADVSAFRDAPFYRTTFDSTDNGFKTSLYIADANHTHFNTAWGSRDVSLPRGIFLNQQDTLRPEEQQQIAKVYVSAFLERIFNQVEVYDELFQNDQFGSDWLPDTTYVNKYKAASYKPIKTYRESDLEQLKLTGFTKQEIYRPENRDSNKRKLTALELAWKEEATYTLAIPSAEVSTADKLIFTMANVDTAEKTQTPNIQLEVVTADGTIHMLPFADYMDFPAVITTKFTKFGLFENSFRNEKYLLAWEPIFQTFEIPTKTFKGKSIQTIRLHFLENSGNILIEEIGVEASE